MKILSLYDLSGEMVRPWANNGHECTIVDILPTRCEIKNVKAIKADLRKWRTEEQYDLVFAFPPCTDLAVSGARWFKSKAEKNPNFQEEAMELFDIAEEIALEVNSLGSFTENPVSVLSTKRRKPNYYFHPHEYAGYLGGEDELFTKKTCLWIQGDFIMPVKKSLKPIYGSKMHSYGPSKNRAFLRSITAKGFARAVYESNKNLRKDV